MAKFVSDRHFGIGSDGLILIRPSEIADCEMDMYNLDGSQGAMCGNGIRCVANMFTTTQIRGQTFKHWRHAISNMDLIHPDAKSWCKSTCPDPFTAKEIWVVAAPQGD